MDAKRKLLALIRNHGELYNTNLAEYKNITSRNEAWNRISENMGVSVEDCKTEWIKLRNCYVNALRRRVNLHNRVGKTLPPWVYETEMSFLKPFMTGRGYDDIPYTVLLQNHSYEFDHETSIESVIVKDENDTEAPNYEEHEYTEQTEIETVDKNRKKKFRNEDTYDILETNSQHKALSYQDHLNEMDESDLFFLGLSQTFKKLPKVEQCRLKMDIFKIMNDAEMRHLEESNKLKSAKRRLSLSD